jgi:hypothetical protein
LGMTEEMWDLVIAIHLKGTYKVSCRSYHIVAKLENAADFAVCQGRVASLPEAEVWAYYHNCLA